MSYQDVVDSIFSAGGQPDVFLLSQHEWDWLPDTHKRIRAGKKEILDYFRGWSEVEISKNLEV